MYIKRSCLIILILFLTVCFITPITNVEATVDQNSKKLEMENEELKQRIKKLEPPVPVNIQDPPWGELSFPSKIKPISEVIHNGTKIPFDLIVDKPEYERPAYNEQWHSTIGRWSYVPNRIHFALHRLFTNYDIGLSGWYDFEHNMGITIPMFQNEKALDMYIVTFQTQVTSVYTIGNQVVVVGTPQRNGVQVITITTKDLKPFNKKENLLIQLATKDEHEIDYSLISYIQPDFWAKQKEK
ncbi:hypothetical protein [Schinkia azotoformans]|uniref:hypothetical protein n=1 Tax=Schinkia azotoformans TaxID=1454 RepID=UPI002DBC6D73|nr:hypothetical protein [Schinkia azotoformans]MEC1722983.1 hypothetical protein [Schinkia azotoformans]MED4413149.1 hypothetical protein [Schinkia azotoformans]